MVSVEVEDADSEETVVVVVAVEVVRTKTKLRLRGLINPSIRGPSTQISQQVTGWGARCTSGGGGQLSSVRNRPHAHGRMCTLKNQKINETGTSPV